MRDLTINVNEWIMNGIEAEIEELESNGNIRFRSHDKRKEFLHDMQGELIESFENDEAYYNSYNSYIPYNINFRDCVTDKINWDSEYYDIELKEW